MKKHEYKNIKVDGDPQSYFGAMFMLGLLAVYFITVGIMMYVSVKREKDYNTKLERLAENTAEALEIRPSDEELRNNAALAKIYEDIDSLKSALEAAGYIAEDK